MDCPLAVSNSPIISSVLFIHISSLEGHFLLLQYSAQLLSSNFSALSSGCAVVRPQRDLLAQGAAPSQHRAPQGRATQRPQAYARLRAL